MCFGNMDAWADAVGFKPFWDSVVCFCFSESG